MKKRIYLLIALAALHFVACSDRSTDGEHADREAITIKDAYGLSPQRIEELWEQPLVEVEGSFAILVSKNLHPYSPPTGNKLMRYGDSYIILEFSDDQLIAIHQISG